MRNGLLEILVYAHWITRNVCIQDTPYRRAREQRYLAYNRNVSIYSLDITKKCEYMLIGLLEM